MSKNIYKFLDDYVAVIQETPYGSKMDKMSYLDFYKMVKEMDERSKDPSRQISGKTPVEFYKNHIEKYDVLQNKLGLKRNPLFIKQYRFNEQGDFYLTLEVGKKGNYLMDRVYDEDLEYVNTIADYSSIYLIVLKIGFTVPRSESAQPKPNKIECVSLFKKDIQLIEGKPKAVLVPVDYLLNKVNDMLNENINDIKGSKLSLIKDFLIVYEKSIDSYLRFVTQKDLSNPTFVKAYEESIATNKGINWEGVEY